MARVGIKALVSTNHPILVHLIAIRRCNLDCTYCNEFDKVSAPVATEKLLARVDRLGELGATVITISGGEPMLHPDLDQVITRIRERGAVAELLTNAYLLSAKRIGELGDAGLQRMQISIDNVKPDDVSKKSLQLLDKKLVLLAEHAEFDVNINSVIGGGIKDPEDALVIAKRVVSLGFTSTVGVIHDGNGQLKPLSLLERLIYDQIKRLSPASVRRVYRFQDNLVAGKPNDWCCRAGARYLYICEDGLVHYCSQQRGHPGVPLEHWGLEDLRREFYTPKSCAPYCTVSCVHAVATLDKWRAPSITRGH
jgi:MoaA/NifB/PqqE/SkfB family radical SAM enzyme